MSSKYPPPLPQHFRDDINAARTDPDPEIRQWAALMFRDCPCGGIKFLGKTFTYLCTDCRQVTDG